MILPPFRYVRPSSAAEAVSLLDQIEGAAVLGGGQTLMNALKLDMVGPSALVDVHRLDELQGVEHADGVLRIGAAVTYAELAAHPLVQDVAPTIAEMAAGLVDRQVRNRGTIGGNCALNDPANNYPPLLVALGAQFEVLTTEGLQVIEAEDFFLDTMYTAVTDGGVLVAIRVPDLPEGHVVVHNHMQLANDSWSMARAVVRLNTTGGKADAAVVAIGTVPGSPVRLAKVEEALAGADSYSDELKEAVGAAFDAEDVEFLGDSHGSADYRRSMMRVLLRRTVNDALLEVRA